MGKTLEIYCDGPNCNERKRDTNHWWIVRIDGCLDHSFLVMPMSKVEEEDKDDKYVCSPKCMHAVLEDYMQFYINQPVLTRVEGQTVEIIDIKQA